jgi:hypothetical protein
VRDATTLGGKLEQVSASPHVDPFWRRSDPMASTKPMGAAPGDRAAALLSALTPI